MPKFSPGEFALLGGMTTNEEHKGLLKYNGTIVEIIQFEGNVIVGTKFLNQGDWYTILSVVSDLEFYARETVLSKLPDQYDPGGMERFCRNFKFSPPPVRVKAATSMRSV